MKPLKLKIYDYAQMFDSINLEEALSDIYNVGVDDNTLSLLYQANAEVHMAVKTPAGLTERQTIKDIVLQGTLSDLYWPQFKWILLGKNV